jgi:hypothetical protein
VLAEESQRHHRYSHVSDSWLVGLVMNSVLDCGRLVAVGEQHEMQLQRSHWNLAVQDLVEVVFAEVFELALLLQLA